MIIIRKTPGLLEWDEINGFWTHRSHYCEWIFQLFNP